MAVAFYRKIFLLSVLLGTLVRSCFAQTTEGFKALDVYDFFRARTCFTASLKKDPVLANYGLARIHYDRLNHFHSYDSAYKRIHLACIAYSELPEKKRLKLQAKGYNEDVFAQFADSIFIGAFEQARSGKLPGTLSVYIEKFPDSPLRPRAIILRDSAAFSDALKTNTSAAFTEFVTLYPQSNLRDKALKKLDLSRFNETVSLGTLESYIFYLQAYPESEHKGAIEDLIFSKVVPTGNASELYAFVKQYPNNRNVSKAWNRLYYLFTNDQRAESVDAFKARYPEFPYKDKIKEDSALLRTRLFPVVQNERWGYCDSTGTIRIPYQFDDAEYFSENLAIIELNAKKGYINKAGFMPVMPQFTEADPFSNGRAIVETDSAAGIINAIGEWIVLPRYYSISGPFDGLYRVEQNEKYALMDANGKLLTEFQFDEMEPFYEGLAAVAIEGKAGFIDRTGAIVISAQFEDAGDFKSGIARVSIDGKYGLIKSDGTWFIAPKYADIRSVAGDVYLASDEKKCSYFDAQGKLLIRSNEYCTDGPEYSKGFHEGLARAMRKGKSGFIDPKGKWVISPDFDQTTFFSDGMAAFRKKNKWGFINKTGKPLIQPQFEAVHPFHKGFARVKLKGQWGIIGKDGKFLVPPMYNQIDEVGFYWVLDKQGKKGLMNFLLQMELECVYNDLNFKDGLSAIEIELNGQLLLYDTASKRIIWTEAGIP